ncbi:MAG TPA: hypothetical protein PK263_04345 [bacterium]|jgi:hypothetical protein|nr:MAG: hypothetical protein BWX58_00090 [Deltaproteobacteria bacterium ADurb.Bin026]HOX41399.1 hypothetical protein [bacterium]
MSPDNDLFSSQYVSDDGTPLPSVQQPQHPEEKNETEASPDKYGLAKPKRRRIRGKIIYD